MPGDALFLLHSHLAHSSTPTPAMLFTTLTRSAVQRTAATLARPHAAPLAAPHLALRTFAASARVRKDPGEGVGEVRCGLSTRYWPMSRDR